MTSSSSQREKDWHNQRYFGGGDLRSESRVVSRAYIANSYMWHLFQRKMNSVSKLRVLDIGCGLGLTNAIFYTDRGCEYTGVDISEECIKANIVSASASSLDATFIVGNAESLPPELIGPFDLIHINGVVHHVHIESCFRSILPLLSSKARFLITEPLGTNPLINLYRRLTPQLRSPDEKPLSFADIDQIVSYFDSSVVSIHTITSLILIPISLLPGLSFFRPLLVKLSFLTGRLDCLLGRVPFVNSFGWTIIIDGLIES